MSVPQWARPFGFEKAGSGLLPLLERADGDLPFEQRASLGRTDPASGLGQLAQRLECTIDGSWAHACDTRLDRNGELA